MARTATRRMGGAAMTKTAGFAGRYAPGWPKPLPKLSPAQKRAADRRRKTQRETDARQGWVVDIAPGRAVPLHEFIVAFGRQRRAG